MEEDTICCFCICICQFAVFDEEGSCSLHVNMIREDSFLHVLSVHINVYNFFLCVCTCVRAYTHTHTHRASQRVREMKNKAQQKDNIVEQMPKMPKGLDCSFLISRSQHALVLKHHAVGLV